MDEISVISGDKDGADLRREKARGRYYTRCDGKADDAEINEAIRGVGGRQFLGLGEAYERVFGGGG